MFRQNSKKLELKTHEVTKVFIFFVVVVLLILMEILRDISDPLFHKG